MRPWTKITFFVFAFSLPFICTSCSTTRHVEETPTASGGAPDLATENTQLRNQVTSLGQRIDSLEVKLASMNDKVDTARTQVDQLKQGVAPHESAGIGVPVEATTAASDPEAGFVNDAAVSGFRNALILHRAGKYSESILAFTQFLDRYPDHAMAGAAQYYIGENYFKQKEYKLALQEYSRVLTSFDRSHHIADTLSKMSIIQDQLKQETEAKKSRHLLSSLFPQSPAAQDLAQAELAAPKVLDLKPKTEASELAPVPAKAESAPSMDEPPATAPVPTAGESE